MNQTASKRSPQLRVFTRLAALCCVCLALFVVSACADEPLEASDELCTTSEHCAEGQACRQGYCTVTAVSQLRMGFTFIPPNTSDFLPQRIEPFPVTLHEGLQIGLEPSVAVNGTISFVGQALPGPMGVLTFRRPNDDDSLFTQQVRVENGRFESLILPGRYNLTFAPDDPKIPRKTWADKDFTSDTNLASGLLTLPHPDQLLHVRGNITHERLALIGGDREQDSAPVADARVIAVSRTTGTRSTVATTNAEGWYELLVFPDSGIYSLHIAPAYQGAMVPDVVIAEAFVAEDRNLLVTASIGEYVGTALALNLQLDADVLDTERDAAALWEDVIVVLHGQVGHGTLTLREEVSARGAVRFTAFPALYQIEIIPPLTSPLARSTFTFELDRVTSTTQLTIPLKNKVRGRVHDTNGAPMESAKIKFEPLASSTGQGAGSESRAVTATSDASGHFEAWLDRNDYRVTATPQPGSGQPRTTQLLLADDLDQGIELHIISPAPAVVYGTVYGYDWGAMPNVTVQAFANVDGTKRILGEGQTNSSGEFRMVVPSDL